MSRLIGISKAKELIFTARVFSAAEALNFGSLTSGVLLNRTLLTQYKSSRRDQLPGGRGTDGHGKSDIVGSRDVASG